MGSPGRYADQTFDSILFQRVQEGGGVLAQLKPLEDGKVAEGLVHDHDNICRAGDGRVGGGGGVLLHKSQRIFGRIAPGLLHPAVPGGHGKIQQKTVGLCDPLLGVDVQSGQHGSEEKAVGIDCSGKGEDNTQRSGHGVAFGLRGADRQREQIEDQQDQGKNRIRPSHGLPCARPADRQGRGCGPGNATHSG